LITRKGEQIVALKEKDFSHRLEAGAFLEIPPDEQRRETPA
jgi:hypothetical protein